MNYRQAPPEKLIELTISGDRKALGRLLTHIEAAGAEEALIAEGTHQATNGAHIVGVTGAPGSGKSTLVGKLVAEMAAAGAAPGVVAVDPSSPLSGGAILGDRVRMSEIEGVFIRSVATRGHSGGLALSIPGFVRAFDAAGFDPVLIETVGIGQVEVDVTATADTAVVVVTPGMGDAVQANKAGLLELADIFVVNKADQPGAHDAARDLERMLDLSHVTGQEDATYRPPILMVDSLTGAGVGEVHEAISSHHRHLSESGGLTASAKRRFVAEIESRLRFATNASLAELLNTEQATALLESVAERTMSPVAAAAVLWASTGRSE